MPGIVEERRERASDRAEDVDGAPADCRWQGRPVLAGAFRTLLFVLPLLASFVVTSTLYGVLTPPGTGRTAQLGFWLGLLLLGVLVATAAERALRRFLPVAMLMRLTLVFPDQAPSRYRVMRSAASPGRLREIAEGGGPTAAPAVQVLALVAELARHDRHTRGHSERVRVFSDLIAEQLGIVGLDRHKLRWAALLHDVGKLDVPAQVLNKAGRPTREEWAVLQGHPEHGAERAVGLLEWLGPWAGGITEHHERWDGAGYPGRLTGDQITTAGRIVAVADAYETMTAARSYKKPMATRAARQELADCAGAHFEPRVVRAFLAISLPKLLWHVGPVSFLLHLPFLGHLQSASSQLTIGATQLVGPTAVAGLSAAAIVTGVVPAAVLPGAESLRAAERQSADAGAGSPAGTAGSSSGAGPGSAAVSGGGVAPARAGSPGSSGIAASGAVSGAALAGRPVVGLPATTASTDALPGADDPAGPAGPNDRDDADDATGSTDGPGDGDGPGTGAAGDKDDDGAGDGGAPGGSTEADDENGPRPPAVPSRAPSRAPTRPPTREPSRAPSSEPTRAPTSAPSRVPTSAPTSAPTRAPGSAPTSAPTSTPTRRPAPTPPPGQPVGSPQSNPVPPGTVPGTPPGGADSTPAPTGALPAVPSAVPPVRPPAPLPSLPTTAKPSPSPSPTPTSDDDDDKKGKKGKD